MCNLSYLCVYSYACPDGWADQDAKISYNIQRNHGTLLLGRGEGNFQQKINFSKIKIKNTTIFV